MSAPVEAGPVDAFVGRPAGIASPAIRADAAPAEVEVAMPQDPATLPPGTRIRVRDDWPELRGPAHVRTPHYLRGREGRVVRLLGRFPNPEDLAFARPAPRLPLYHVAFPPRAIWPDATHSPDGDELLVELFGPWLEAPP